MAEQGSMQAEVKLKEAQAKLKEVDVKRSIGFFIFS